MAAKSSPQSPAEASPRPSPGRPKDLAKRAAILEAAKAMFVQNGYAGTSMDQIAAQAGVSKLTVYSHFGDKESLYGAVVRAYCERQLPDALFDPVPGEPPRQRLQAIGDAFFAMVSAPEAVAGHRILCSPEIAGTPLAQVFWNAGPQRVQGSLAKLLDHFVAEGALEAHDTVRASAQFFALVKGEAHARLVFGCCDAGAADVRGHVRATVDMFLRAYARDRGAGP